METKYQVKIIKTFNGYRAEMNGKSLAFNEDLDSVRFRAGFVINELHKALGLPEIKMLDISFETGPSFKQQRLDKQQAIRIENRAKKEALKIENKAMRKIEATVANHLGRIRNAHKKELKLYQDSLLIPAKELVPAEFTLNNSATTRFI